MAAKPKLTIWHTLVPSAIGLREVTSLLYPQKLARWLPFFNPRIDRWSDHFQLLGLSIQPRTEIGEVTVRILRFNDNERILERQELNKIGRYPNTAALARFEG